MTILSRPRGSIRTPKRFEEYFLQRNKTKEETTREKERRKREHLYSTCALKRSTTLKR